MTHPTVLYLSFGNEKPYRLPREFCIHSWPDKNEYPANFLSVVVFGRSHDYNEFRLTSNIRLSDLNRWQCKWNIADRNAEKSLFS